MKSITSYLLILLLAFSAGSCKKNIEQDTSEPIETLARKTLAAQMDAKAFSDLDWSKKDLLAGRSGKADAFIRIPSKSVPHKSLYFKTEGSTVIYNWVEIKNETRINDKVSADVILSDIRNKLIENFSVVNNKYVASAAAGKPVKTNSVKQNGDEPELSGSGGDAVVTGYIKSRNQTQTYWRIDFLLRGSSNEELYAPEEGGGGDGGGWSATFVFDDPNPDEVEPDTTYYTAGGMKHFSATSYSMVLGRVITVEFAVNMNTFEVVGDVKVKITGVGAYTINYLGVKSSYVLGYPDKDLFIELNMTYTVVNFTPIGIPIDITFPVRWTIKVPWINYGGNKVKLY